MNAFNIEKYSCGNEPPQYFSQINVYQNFHFRCKPKSTIGLNAEVKKFEVASVNIIDTINGTSIEGQCLTGKKVVIVGSFKVSVKVKDNRKKQYSVIKKLPFSTYIIIPANIDYDHFICLRYLIEDVTALVICKNKLFINIALFLQYEP